LSPTKISNQAGSQSRYNNFRSIGVPESEEAKLEKTLAEKGLKSKLMGIEEGDSAMNSLVSFNNNTMGGSDLDLENETNQKLSMNRYISFLDNVVIKLPKGIKAKQDPLFAEIAGPNTQYGQAGKMTLRQYMTEEAKKNNN
jgi:hypothetical protein